MTRRLTLVVGVGIAGSCLETGAGERFSECAHYEDGLDGARWYYLARRSERAIRCPLECARFTPRDDSRALYHLAASRQHPDGRVR